MVTRVSKKGIGYYLSSSRTKALSCLLQMWPLGVLVGPNLLLVAFSTLCLDRLTAVMVLLAAQRFLFTATPIGYVQLSHVHGVHSNVYAVNYASYWCMDSHAEPVAVESVQGLVAHLICSDLLPMSPQELTTLAACCSALT